MLQFLTINNYALLVDVEIEFGPGLNILTGETGAGKSIILGALGIILGERVDTSTLRQGAAKAVVEGQFSIEKNPALKRLLGELDVGDGTLILRREILESGRTRAFVNDTPVPLTTLQEIGNLLVDLHGQHEHQSLLKVQSHLTYLDQFGNLEQEAQHVAQTFAELQAARSKLRELQEKQRTLTEKKDLYA
ncbi:MAG: DNA repair protein RecN, partial [Calditrichaeota bacterium]